MLFVPFSCQLIKSKALGFGDCPGSNQPAGCPSGKLASPPSLVTHLGRRREQGQYSGLLRPKLSHEFGRDRSRPGTKDKLVAGRRDIGTNFREAA
jgi:hypothetical protein